MDIRETFEQAKDAAQRLLGHVIEDAPIISNLREALETTAEVERRLGRMADVLKTLDQAGYATRQDFNAYNRIQSNLQRCQSRLLPIVRRVFVGRTDVLAALPTKIRKADRLYQRGFSAPQGQALQGLGNLRGPEVAAPAAGLALAPWMICAIVIATLVSMAVIAVVAATTAGLIVSALRDILVTRATVEAQERVIEARNRIFEECINRGGDPIICANTAKDTVPDYVPPALPGNPYSWIPWVVGGVVILATFGTAIYFYSKLSGGGGVSDYVPRLSGAKRGNRKGTRGAARYRRLPGSTFHNQSVEDDGLEV